MNSESWTSLLSQLPKQNLVSLLQKQGELLDDACAQRDVWKANHDNQVKIKRAIIDRPDLKERARLVMKLIEDLRACHDDNESLHIRVSKLEEEIRKINPDHVMLPENIININ